MLCVVGVTPYPPTRPVAGASERPPSAGSATVLLRMEPSDERAARVARSRERCLRQRHNWEQLLKFCVVGATGYVVNLAVYALLAQGRRGISTMRRGERRRSSSRRPPTTPSTGTGPSARSADMSASRDARFSCRVSTARLSRQSRAPVDLVSAGVGKIVGQAIGDRARDTAQLRRQQALELPAAVARWGAWGSLCAGVVRTRSDRARRRPPRRRDRRRNGRSGRPRRRPTFAQPQPDRGEATAAFLAAPKVRRWLERYPPAASHRSRVRPQTRRWTVHVWSGSAGEIARGRSRTSPGGCWRRGRGPQVAWTMARGCDAAFGEAYSELVGLGCLAARSSSSVSRTGEASDPAHARRARAPVLHRLAVLLRSGRGLLERPARLSAARLSARPGGLDRPQPERGSLPYASSGPTALLFAAAMFLFGFRVGVNVQGPGTVIDVGYAGVIGGDRILHGESPYGHMPVSEGRPECGSRARRSAANPPHVQTNGRCENANPYGDTYGPVSYLAYVPAVAAFGWNGRWDSLPAAHAAAIVFDLLIAIGLGLAGLRFGGRRLGPCSSSPGRLSVHRLRDELEHERCDHAGAPGLGLSLRSVALRARRSCGVVRLDEVRGARRRAALAHLPDPGCGPRSGRRVASWRQRWRLLRFSCSNPASAMRSRRSGTGRFGSRRPGLPVSLWDWGQYHARGLPDLHVVQIALEIAVAVFAVVIAFVPRRERGPLELAALTGALLVATQLVLTHWFYLYLPWLLPFVLLALFLASR